MISARAQIMVLCALILPLSAAGQERDGFEIESCALNGKALFGRVQIVEAFPDFKVRRVESFADIRVKIVDSFPDECGEWQIVESFPDFTVQFVDSFADFDMTEVPSFPGIDG